MYSDDSGLEKQIKQAQVLVLRLERISVDSYWAHRASGVRTALLRCMDRFDVRNSAISPGETMHLEMLLKEGYFILEQAAKELRGKSN